MKVRIIAGTLKGRALEVANSAVFRPTTGRHREMVFNVVQQRIVNASFLDLYAGTGAVGLEALSRGAKSAVFVESDPGRSLCLQERIRHFGLQHRAFVLTEDVNILSLLREPQPQFDFIYLDPPYNEFPVARLSDLADLLRPGGMVIQEYASRHRPQPSNRFNRIKTKASGSSGFQWLERK